MDGWMDGGGLRQVLWQSHGGGVCVCAAGANGTRGFRKPNPAEEHLTLREEREGGVLLFVG